MFLLILTHCRIILKILIVELFLWNVCDCLESFFPQNESNKNLIKRKAVVVDLHNGKPHLANCMPDVDSAKAQYFLMRNGFSITTIWNGSKSGLDNPLDMYKVNFSARSWAENEDIKRSGGQVYPLVHFLKRNGTMIHVPPYRATPGLFKLTMNAAPSSHDPNKIVKGHTVNLSCWFFVKSLPPIVVIAGGTYRKVPHRVPVTVSAASSMDLNMPLDSHNIRYLTFAWSCTQKLSNSFCKDGVIGTSSSLIVPSGEVVEGEMFNVSVRVNTSSKTSDAGYQVIEVEADAATLNLRCEKNCPPVSDYSNAQSITFFRVSCEQNCDGVEEDHFEWEIAPLSGAADFKFDYNKDTHFGRIGPKFIVSKDVLRPNNDYLVTVRLLPQAGHPGEARTLLRYAPAPQIEKCEIRPPKGRSLETLFSLVCTEVPPPDKNNFYELYVDEKMSESVVSGYPPDVFDVAFLLPPSQGRKFTVRVAKGSGPAVFLEVYPSVETAAGSKSSDEVLDIYHKFVNGSSGSVSHLISSSNPRMKEKGIKMFQALVNEVVANGRSEEMYEFARNMTNTVIRDLLKAPPEDTQQLLTMGDSIAKVVEYHELVKSDPALAKLASSVCKLMVTAHAKEMKKQKFPLNSETQFTTVGRVLTKCMEANVRENFDLISPVEHNITVAELPPLETAIAEYYPDYVDYGDEYGTHLEDFNTLTNNIFDSAALAAKTLALTTATGEHFARRSGKHTAILVAKDLGKDLAETKIEFSDVVLIPSHDFEKNDHPFDILITSWNKDLLWWNHLRTKVVTSLVGIQFWHSTCQKRIRNFKSPLNMLMTIKNTSEVEPNIVESDVFVPLEYEKIDGKELNKYMRIHRIGLLARSVLHVQFHKLEETDRLDVVLTKFEFPSFKNFARNETIRYNVSTYMRIINYEIYDMWGYLAVLPSKRDLSGNPYPNVFYSVSFLSSFCIRWDRKKRAWKPDCKPGLASTLQVINCECQHFSVLAGYMQNTESMIQELEEIEIVVELDRCHIIFVTLVITFAIYCILIMLVVFRRKSNVYFLADNMKNHLYAYLLTVRTENMRDAGTTSKVTIRLSGAKGMSEPHVLNYPDPKMRLLQRQGEDMFVLTTEHHLGDMTKIELWYDCTGPSPTWACRDIVVYDLQKHQQWYFKIKTLFSFSHGVAQLAVAPTEFGANVKAGHFRICNHFHTWQLWAREKNFSYAARTTVVFSHILMIYALFLYMQGLPEFELCDVFDKYHKVHIPGDALSSALMCGFISFVPHMILAWVFRFSNIEFSAFNKMFRQAYNLTAYCWVVLAILIGCSMCVLIFYGFWIPATSSLVWLICCCITIIFDIFILENAFIIVQTFICKFKLTLSISEKMEEYYVNMIEAQRKFLYKKFPPDLLRPFLSHLYRPLRRVQIARRRIVARLRRTIYDDLEDLVLYGIYNIFLYIVILLNKGTLTTINRREVLSMAQGEHTRTLSFSKMASLSQVYEYINFTLIPTMQPAAWYENHSVSDAGFMIDNANKVIGVARLRQHRIRTDLCEVPEVMKFLNMSCWPEFSLARSEYMTFGPQWTEFVPAHDYDRLKSIWAYQSEYDTETLGAFGRLTTYSGGGYVAFLGRTIYNSYVNIINICSHYWLDHKTRSLFIEFLIYNVNHNLFVAVNLMVEYSATGYISKFADVNVVRMLFVQNEVELANMIFFILFAVWVLMLMLKLSIGIVKHITTFYKRFWLMIDLLINMMSILSIGMFVLRMKMVENYLGALEGVKHNEFVSYFSLLYVEEFLTISAGVLICVATARLWKFLRFGLFFRIMERTLAMASYPLLGVTFSFSVTLTAFGLSGILIYGNEFPELSNFIKIVATLIQLSLKPDQFDLTVYLDVKISYYYFALYLVMMQVVLLVYITVIIMAYVKAQLEFSVEPDGYTVGDYIKEQFHYIPLLMRTKLYRLRGGDKEKKSVVTPKADEFRYANCVGVPKSRMKAMRFIVSCIVRNMNQSSSEQAELTEHETLLMLGVCKTLVLKIHEGDELELFFKGHFAGQKIRLVDEKRITKVADFVQIMFRRKVEEKEVEQDTNEVQCAKMAREKIRILGGCNLRLKLAMLKIKEIERKIDLLELAAGMN